MKRWPIIRHIRWYWHMGRYVSWWQRFGSHYWLYPNVKDLEYLNDIWVGRS